MADTGYPSIVQIAANGDIIVPGIELPEASGGAQADENSISWLNPAGGVQSFIQGWAGGTDHHLGIVTNADADDQVALLLDTVDAGAAGDSVLSIELRDHTGPGAAAFKLDSSGRASFPQLPALAKTVYQSFVAPLTWPGGSQSMTAAFTHGLLTPASARYHVTYEDTGGGFLAFACVLAPTVLGCTIGIADPFGTPPNGATFGVSILSILEY